MAFKKASLVAALALASSVTGANASDILTASDISAKPYASGVTGNVVLTNVVSNFDGNSTTTTVIPGIGNLQDCFLIAYNAALATTKNSNRNTVIGTSAFCLNSGTNDQPPAIFSCEGYGTSSPVCTMN